MWTNEYRARYDRSKLRYPSDVTDFSANWRLLSLSLRASASMGVLVVLRCTTIRFFAAISRIHRDPLLLLILQRDVRSDQGRASGDGSEFICTSEECSKL